MGGNRRGGSETDKRDSTDAFLGALCDATGTGMVLIDPEGRVGLWNAWMARASSIQAPDAIGKHLDAILPMQPMEAVNRAVTRALSDGIATTLTSGPGNQLFSLKCTAMPGIPAEDMRHVAEFRPLEQDGQRVCLIQIFDVTASASREDILRRQARTMEALAENYRLSELHNRAIVDHTADAIITFSEDGAIGTFNPAAERIFGYAPHQIVGKSIGTVIPQLMGGQGQPITTPYLDQRTEVLGVRVNRVLFPLELSLADMELGGQKLFVAIGHDITIRKNNEEELRTQKEWLSTLINALPDLICFKDGDGRWLVANQFYLDLVGIGADAYAGRSAQELALLSPDHREFLLSSRDTDERAWTERQPLSYEKTVPSEGGPSRIFDVIKIPLFTPEGRRRGLVLVGRDITERKLAAARIQHLAHHDALTELPNRTLFTERLRLALAQSRRGGGLMALLFLDLDKFKDINDTLGHHVGDLLLKAVAHRLRRCVRETDTVARLGGDEFAVILTNLETAEGAARVAESIITVIGEPYALEEQEVLTSTSVGITLFPGDGEDAEQLLKNADLAMFRSKAEGRNTYHFYVAAMDAEVQARKIVERDMRAALGTEQLRLHYQPLIEVSSGAVVGCEALLRWLHPTRGWVPPGEFIPIIERTELIAPLGRWILEEACRQGAVWRDHGLPPLKIAVNLSPAQFKQPQTLIPMMTEILEVAGVSSELLQLEITEGIAMQNVEATIEALQGLRAMGLTISIDDFGTGYSSLNYLKRFPVDKLKIDRSFVVDIGQHPGNAAVVNAIVTLGHSLGTRVNVEGVETIEQLDFLKTHQVDEAQGFYFARPLPPEDFATLVREKNPWPL